jgi:hypothetical protein
MAGTKQNNRYSQNSVVAASLFAAASSSMNPKNAPTHQSTDDKESSNHSGSTMKVKVIGERVIVLLDLSREEYVRFQVPFTAAEATTTTARPATTTARPQEALL